MTNQHSRLGEMATAAALCARNRDTLLENEEKVDETEKKRTNLTVDVTPQQRGTFVTEGFGVQSVCLSLAPWKS